MCSNINLGTYTYFNSDKDFFNIFTLPWNSASKANNTNYKKYFEQSYIVYSGFSWNKSNVWVNVVSTWQWSSNFPVVYGTNQLFWPSESTNRRGESWTKSIFENNLIQSTYLENNFEVFRSRIVRPRRLFPLAKTVGKFHLWNDVLFCCCEYINNNNYVIFCCYEYRNKNKYWMVENVSPTINWNTRINKNRYAN